MADVFINYKREDQETARALAESVAKLGLTTWWDARIPAGSRWDEVIERELRSAKCVVTLWSHNSIKSRWVRLEADEALKMGRLISIRLDDVSLPMGFRHLQAIDHFNGRPFSSSKDFAAIATAINTILSHPSTSNPTPPIDEQNGGQSSSQPAPDRRFQRHRAAWRTRIFIAHASDDKPRLKPIVELLVLQGFPVWIDKPHELELPESIECKLMKNRIRHAGDWKEQIRLAVNSAHVVLGFWSKSALTGEREQFNYEMYVGLIRGKLQQCRLDNITEADIGYPWRFEQMANLATYKPGRYHPELDMLMTDLVKRPILGF